MGAVENAPAQGGPLTVSRAAGEAARLTGAEFIGVSNRGLGWFSPRHRIGSGLEADQVYGEGDARAVADIEA